jgi:hypothetical protein
MAEVAALVRQKIAAGTLPTETPLKSWVGKGSGKPCEACDLVVTPGDMEFEVDMPEVRTLRSHRDCFKVWDEERARV